MVSFTLFRTSGWGYVWISPKEAYNPECLVPTVKHGTSSVMFWGTVSSILLVVLTLNGRITASDYVDILGSQVHRVVYVLFSNNDAVFQDDDSPIHTARS